MINEVKIYSRFEMENFARMGDKFPYKERPWYLISIHSDPDDSFLTDFHKEAITELGCRDAVSLQFWDITDEQASKIMEAEDEQAKRLQEGLKLFGTEDAKTVMGFIMSSNQDDEADGLLVVHCDAGISRSGAVGTFAVDFLRLDYQEFINKNTYIRPNYYVLRVLRRMSDMTPKFIEEAEHRDEETDKGKIYHGEIGTIFLPDGEIYDGEDKEDS